MAIGESVGRGEFAGRKWPARIRDGLAWLLGVSAILVGGGHVLVVGYAATVLSRSQRVSFAWVAWRILDRQFAMFLWGVPAAAVALGVAGWVIARWRRPRAERASLAGSARRFTMAGLLIASLAFGVPLGIWVCRVVMFRRLW